MYLTEKEEVSELTDAQKKLPPALQKAIEKKDKKKAKVEESINEDARAWKSLFKGYNESELNVINRFIGMNSKGVGGVLKMRNDRPSDFKKAIKKMSKTWMGQSIKESINEGPSSEEKRIAMIAVRKQAKYRNVSLESAIQDQINALEELKRDAKRGKIK